MVATISSLVLAAALVPMPRAMEIQSGFCRAGAPLEVVRDASIPKEGYRLSIARGIGTSAAARTNELIVATIIFLSAAAPRTERA